MPQEPASWAVKFEIVHAGSDWLGYATVPRVRTWETQSLPAEGIKPPIGTLSAQLIRGDDKGPMIYIGKLLTVEQAREHAKAISRLQRVGLRWGLRDRLLSELSKLPKKAVVLWRKIHSTSGVPGFITYEADQDGKRVQIIPEGTKITPPLEPFRPPQLGKRKPDQSLGDNFPTADAA